LSYPFYLGLSVGLVAFLMRGLWVATNKDEDWVKHTLTLR